MKKQLLFMFALFLLPLLAQAEADLSIHAEDIRFSQEELIVGDQIRIYAKVYNIGDEDVSGYVSFYQGATLLDDSLVISLPAGGSPEEVYIDFVVPEGTFNILAIIRGTNPSDLHSENDSTLTSTFEPVEDEDRDGVKDDEDNCDDSSNQLQTDSDGDGEGDACDSDDDNDRLSDDVEVELGSNPVVSDSDNDGVTDVDDAYPTDPEQTTVSQDTESREVPDTVLSSDTNAFQKVVDEVARAIKETVAASQSETEPSLSEEDVVADSSVSVQQEALTVSPNAVFGYTQDDWNTFTFRVLSQVDAQAVYIWDFGDGVTSSKPSIQHVYTRSGSFLVALTMTDAGGVVETETTEIFVPFFSFKNRFVLVLVGFLSVLLVGAMAFFIRLGRKRR